MTEEKQDLTGRAKGGLAVAANMTAEELKERAKKGAAARWGEKLPQATHKGNFKTEFGADVECYVLNDGAKTAVISQTGMGKAIGLSSRGNAFPRFLASRAMVGALGAELDLKFQNPLKFQWTSGGAPLTLNGYDATLLIDLCKAILNASVQGKLKSNQTGIAQQAAIIVAASAKSGIKGLVYALAGYNPTADEVIQAFKLYVREEAKKYEPEFPNELYAQWQRLYEISLPDRGKPWEFMHLTRRHIYYPLAQSNGKIYDLVRALKARGGDQKKKLFQFLSEVGARALRIHIGRVLEMAESSHAPNEYERKITTRFGSQQELELIIPPAEA